MRTVSGVGPSLSATDEIASHSYQIHMAVTALVAYHNRTGADMSRWFGQHQLPQEVRPQPTLAQAA